MNKKSTTNTKKEPYCCGEMATISDFTWITQNVMNSEGNSNKGLGSNNWLSSVSKMVLLFAFLLSSFYVSAQSITVDGTPGDWQAVLTGPAPIKGRITDPINNTDDIWTGGSKDIQQISQWVWTTNSANDKNNIANVGYYLDGSVLYLTGQGSPVFGSDQLIRSAKTFLNFSTFGRTTL